MIGIRGNIKTTIYIDSTLPTTTPPQQIDVQTGATASHLSFMFVYTLNSHSWRRGHSRKSLRERLSPHQVQSLNA